MSRSADGLPTSQSGEQRCSAPRIIVEGRAADRLLGPGLTPSRQRHQRNDPHQLATMSENQPEEQVATSPIRAAVPIPTRNPRRHVGDSVRSFNMT